MRVLELWRHPVKAMLGVLGRHHRLPLGPLGDTGCVGAYAEVVRPGRLRAGDLVEAGERTAGSALEAIARTLARMG